MPIQRMRTELLSVVTRQINHYFDRLEERIQKQEQAANEERAKPAPVQSKPDANETITSSVANEPSGVTSEPELLDFFDKIRSERLSSR